MHIYCHVYDYLFNIILKILILNSSFSFTLKRTEENHDHYVISKGQIKAARYIIIYHFACRQKLFLNKKHLSYRKRVKIWNSTIIKLIIWQICYLRSYGFLNNHDMIFRKKTEHINTIYRFSMRHFLKIARL